jgi:hypothetical protein
MDEDAAKGAAILLFSVISLIVKMFRKDHQLVRPTDSEIAQLGRAIQKSTYRRLNAIGAYDDLFMLATALGSYTTRAITTPAVPALPAPP